MTRTRARRGAGNLGLPLMLVTFVLMGGFLYWLYLNAVPTPDAEVVEAADETVEAQLQATEADLTTLEESPQGYEGMVIRVTDIPASSPVGSEAFFIELPRTPFLVKLGDELLAAGTAVPSGPVTVAGELKAMNDSIVAAWTAAGAITEGDAPIVGFATHFIEALELQVLAPAAEGGEGAAAEPSGN